MKIEIIFPYHSLKSFNLQEITNSFFTFMLYMEAMSLGITITGVPPYFAMENAENHKVIFYFTLFGRRNVE